MKIVKKEIVNHEVKYIVEANQESWKKSQDNSYKILSKQLKIPGFRAGRVPLDVAKKQISSSEVMNHALKKVIDENYRLLLDSKDFIRDELIEEGVSVDIAKIDEATLQIVYIFEKVPEVTIDQDYRKIKIECVEPAIQQSDIENEINRYTKKDTMLIPKENGIIAHGDMVNFDFKGFLDDKPFPGGEAKGYELEIGSNTFIPGFEEQMINLKKDDKKTIDITFPKDYQAKDLAGKKTKFELVINDVKTIQRPKMDETYIAKFGIPNIKTVAEFKKYVGDQLLDHKKYIAKQEAVKEISKWLVDHTKLSYVPKSLLDSELKRIQEDITKKAQEAKVDKEKYIISHLGYKNHKEFDKALNETAINNISLVLAIEKIISDLKLDISDAEIDEHLIKIAKVYGIKLEDVKERFKGNYDNIWTMLLQEKMFDKLIEINKNN